MEDNYLPGELIMEILEHLPVKSLLRFKCVSKSWLSMISDPSFAEMHYQRSSQQHNHRVLFSVRGCLRSIDINKTHNDHSGILKLQCPFFKPRVNIRILTPSCRGFLLLRPQNEDNIYLWNPITNHISKKIPMPHPCRYISSYGFCYDESTDDYLIVIISLYPPHYYIEEYSKYYGFDLFSLRTNSWVKVALTRPLSIDMVFTRFSGSGSVSNGAIHWLPQPLEAIAIIAFDIRTRNLRESIPIPSASIDSSHLELGVLEGSLSLTQTEGNKVHIWVMKDYRVDKPCWTKLFSLYWYRISWKDHLLALCFNKDGQLIAENGIVGLSRWGKNGILLENYQPCPWRWNDLDTYTFTTYTESLISLP